MGSSPSRWSDQEGDRSRLRGQELQSSITWGRYRETSDAYPSNSPSSGVCSPTERNASATAPRGLL